MADDYHYEMKENFEGKTVKVLGATYEAGKPERQDNWRSKLNSRDDMVNYLRSAVRYWYSKDWYGSEKRKQEA